MKISDIANSLRNFTNKISNPLTNISLKVIESTSNVELELINSRTDMILWYAIFNESEIRVIRSEDWEETPTTSYQTEFEFYYKFLTIFFPVWQKYTHITFKDFLSVVHDQEISSWVSLFAIWASSTEIMLEIVSEMEVVLNHIVLRINPLTKRISIGSPYGMEFEMDSFITGFNILATLFGSLVAAEGKEYNPFIPPVILDREELPLEPDGELMMRDFANENPQIPTTEGSLETDSFIPPPTGFPTETPPKELERNIENEIPKTEGGLNANI